MIRALQQQVDALQNVNFMRTCMCNRKVLNTIRAVLHMNGHKAHVPELPRMPQRISVDVEPDTTILDIKAVVLKRETIHPS